MCIDFSVRTSWSFLFILYGILLTRTSCLDEFPRREYNLMKPFKELGSSVSNWRLSGTAMTTDTHVQLTDDLPGQSGAVWNKRECMFHHWDMELVFRIHGTSPRLFGDGMALWYVDHEPVCSGHGGCTVFGGANLFTGLAVFIDTYNNFAGLNDHEYPYVSVMVNNGTQHYNHDEDGGADVLLSGCSAQLRGRPHHTRLRLRYLYDQLTVFLDVDGEGSWRQCVHLEEVLLPPGYYFGVSAATGDLHDRHDVMSLRVTQLDAPDMPLRDSDADARRRRLPHAARSTGEEEEAEEDGGVWAGVRKLLLLLLAVVVLCAVVVLAAVWYGPRLQRHTKRLY